jgi:alpha-tubulin suppressor-like RCC1 family protein
MKVKSRRLVVSTRLTLLVALALVIGPIAVGVPAAAVEAAGAPEAGPISAGDKHTCGLAPNGQLQCWGVDFTSAYMSHPPGYPVAVTDMTSGVVAVAAGNGGHTCALSSGGGVKCWGWNVNGQLGDGTTTSRLTPADVTGLTSGVDSISAGAAHTCAITSAGGLKCWGANYSGELGDGSGENRHTPVDVIGMTSGVTAVSGGQWHTCGVVAGGAKCWGANANGRLGNGSETTSHVPVDVSDLSSGVTDISAGVYHSCAVVSGAAMCWGSNLYGQLGDESTTERWEPVAVSGLTSGVVAISAGQYHSCALTSTGGVKCWGDDFSGQLGDVTVHPGEFSDIPVDVASLTSGVTAISVGRFHTCARMASGGAKCWGDNFFGQLGDGTRETRRTPVDVLFWNPPPDDGSTLTGPGSAACDEATQKVKEAKQKLKKAKQSGIVQKIKRAKQRLKKAKRAKAQACAL